MQSSNPKIFTIVSPPLPAAPAAPDGKDAPAAAPLALSYPDALRASYPDARWASAVDGEQAERVKAALAALAPNTRRAYRAALAAWAQWCGRQGVDMLAAPAAAVRAYLLQRADAGTGLSALNTFVSALRKLQAVQAVAATARDPMVSDTLTALARDARPAQQVGGLTANALTAIAATACRPRVGRGGRPETEAHARARGLVDIALCRVLSDAGLRRSEAAALRWGDLSLGGWQGGGGRLDVVRRKTGAKVSSVYLTKAAVAALTAIQPDDWDAGAPVFGLSAAQIARRVKAAALAAGLGASFSGHSGRVGMAQRMTRAGAPTHEIMAQGGWKSPEMVGVYTRAEEAGRAAPWLE